MFKVHESTYSLFRAEEKFVDFENGVGTVLGVDHLHSVSDVDLGERFVQIPEAERSYRCF